MSRDQILSKLQSRKRPFPHISPPTAHHPMTPLSSEADELIARFIQEAEALAAVVHQPEDEPAAVDTILNLIGNDTSILAWDWSHVPLPSLPTELEARNIRIAPHDDAAVRVGITGVNGALAATGSLVMVSGNGRYRTTSLLPPVHIAIMTTDQISPNLESWLENQRAETPDLFKNASNIVIISGASRTADIAMELILGMHGPGELHIILL
ncbi:MAG: hypothetical protein GY943_06640 [Chloroflexi bacterium]|nr:hypothetical protein [Chloroflexota bacterium]